MIDKQKSPFRDLGLVTCITPITESRRHYIPHVNRIIAAQDYPDIEHIFIWGETETIGEKRNTGCDRAKGEIIMHIDSDDNYAPDWVSRQVHTLGDADICGLDQLYFYDTVHAEAWKYIWDNPRRLWVAGATQCYRKSFWQKGPFEHIQVGEDNNFVWKEGAEIAISNYTEGFVAMMHGANTSPHHKSASWHPQQLSEVRKLLDKINPPWEASYAAGKS